LQRLGEAVADQGQFCNVCLSGKRCRGVSPVRATWLWLVDANALRRNQDNADNGLVKAFDDAKKFQDDYKGLIEQAPVLEPEGSSRSGASSNSSTATKRKSSSTNKGVKSNETDRLAQVLSSLVDSDSGR
jgi:hypothetical protein